MQSDRRSLARTSGRTLIVLASGIATLAHADSYCFHPATYIVNSAVDVSSPSDGLTTLREAVQQAMAYDQDPCHSALEPYDRIVFDLPAGTTIDLNDVLTVTGDWIHVDGSANGGVVLRMPNVNMPIFFAAAAALPTNLKITSVELNGQDFSRANGALYLVNTALNLDHVTVRNFVNTAGAAVDLVDPPGLYVTNSLFAYNHGTTGGALAVTSTTTGARQYTILNSFFGGNQASTVGGGIYVSDPLATLAITTTTFSGNSAAERGGGIMALTASVLLGGDTVSFNTAGTDGGGIAVLMGSLAMTSSTLSGNAAPNGAGGGIYTTQPDDGYVTLNHVTVTNNHANLAGGVCVAKIAPVAGINGTHTIIAGNVATSNAATNDIGTASFTDLTSSFVGGDPKLAPLADNGGPTWTHMPLVGSPVIDAGDKASLGDALPLTDQRGMARVFGSEIDIGATEYQPPASSGGGGGLGVAVLAVLGVLGLRRRRR